MATSAAKRRKLDHAELSTPNANESYAEESSAASDISADEDATVPKKRSHLKTNRTHEDADNAIYAGDLFKSSIFKLQVDEMLSEVKPNYEQRLNGVNDALKKLKGHIESIEGRGPVSVGVTLPYGIYELTRMCRL